MDQQAALRFLQQNGMKHTPASLQRLIEDGRVTASHQAGNLEIDAASLRAYVDQFQRELKSIQRGGFPGPLGF